jgi:hypothetical protein
VSETKQQLALAKEYEFIINIINSLLDFEAKIDTYISKQQS